MCGIAGIYRFASDRPIPDGVVREMARRLHHRGPDDQGFFISPRLALGHTRLSVIDLSPLGHQPLRDESGRFSLVYNGEIYNFKSLRRELEAAGHRFRSQTDSEVVLRAYMHYGPACVERFIGMFAFAVWDERSEILFLARDRIGEKPLVYAEVNGSFLFASEIESLLASPEIPRTPDLVGLAAYLGTAMQVPYPRTAFLHIKKLPPAHTLTVGQAGLRMRRYWTPDFSRKIQTGFTDAVHELDRILDVTVESMLMSDVPIGLLLSGGIDSSAVAFKMRPHASRMHTFSCGGSETDEEFLRARAVAAQLKTHHTEHVFSLKPEGIFRIIERLGEPLAEPSVVYRMQMCEFLKSEGMTVVLTGDGGDEVFGGYPHYSLLRRYPMIKRVLARLFGPRGPLRALPGAETHLLPRVEIHGSPLPRAVAEAYARMMGANHRRVSCSAQPATQSIEEVRDTLVGWLRAAQVDDLVDAAMFSDLMLTLHHNHIMIPDCVGMSQSLEFRAPFLDVRLVEFAASLPSTFKASLDPSFNKRIVKRSLEHHLPAELVYARKIGYGGNIRYLEKYSAFWSSVCRDLARSGLAEDLGLVPKATILRYAAAPDTMPVKEHMMRFALIMLGAWLDRNDGSGRFSRSVDDALAATSRAL